MNHFKHVIVGGGMTSASAASGIREAGEDGSLAVFSDESHAPYDRPPLSKALWKGEPLGSVWRKTADLDIDLYLGRTIVALNRATKTLTDHSGSEYSYDKLLLATGGSPRRLSFAQSGVVYFRTLDDYQRLRELAREGVQLAVIGGGFIGSEIAAALAMNGVGVTMIFPERSIGVHTYPASLSSFIDAHYRSKGVTVLAGEVVGAIEKAATKTIVSAALDQRMRVEHEDNANAMGRLAGRNMAGHYAPYDHLPFFYSDLFELGYEAVGELDARLEIVEDWQERFRKGVIYYLKQGQVRGVLLWNTWNRVEIARELIMGKQRLPASSFIGRISD
jgi:3-phenylpropionate/trans-cinnamate dioxygenase ferredoxin reductase component